MRSPLYTFFFTAMMIFAWIGNELPAQDKKADSILNVLRDAMPDSSRVKTLNALSGQVVKNKPKDALNYSTEAIKLAEGCSYNDGMVEAYINRSEANRILSNFDLSIEDLYKALKIIEVSGKKKKKAELFIRYGHLYVDMQSKEKALSYFNSALSIYKELKDLQGQAKCHEEIGRYEWVNKQYEKSLQEYFEALKIKQGRKDERGMAFTYQWIGNNYFYLDDLDKAKEYYTRSLELSSKYNDKGISAYDIQNLGFIFMNKENYPQAEKQFLESLQQFEEIGDEQGTIFTFQVLGTLYAQEKKKEKAISSWDSSLRHSIHTGARAYTVTTYSYIYDFYHSTGDLKKAFDFQEKYFNLKDSLMMEENSVKISKLELKYENDKKEDEARAKLKIAEEEKERAEVVRNSLIVGIFLTLLLAIAIFRGYRQKQRSNEEISKQKLIIENKNKDITDSINYALRIQEAILPSNETKEQLFPDSFILLLPKDIVSGDFYWFTEKDGKKILAAADCTGHGVPGAFMSMIGNAFLNEIVNEKGITTPSQILNMLRGQVISSLKQNDIDNKETNPAGIKMQDGMDIALTSMEYAAENPKKIKLEFSGANNPLWIVSTDLKIENSENCIVLKQETAVLNLYELLADKQPVGFEDIEHFPFTNHAITLKKGDTLYIFTDGFADQFGGTQGKKFKYRQLKEKILEINNMTMSDQKKILKKTIETWKGNLEQVDDILIIGVRV